MQAVKLFGWKMSRWEMPGVGKYLGGKFLGWEVFGVERIQAEQFPDGKRPRFIPTYPLKEKL